LKRELQRVLERILDAGKLDLPHVKAQVMPSGLSVWLILMKDTLHILDCFNATSFGYCQDARSKCST
jgi:hypothetical protein